MKPGVKLRLAGNRLIGECLATFVPEAKEKIGYRMSALRFKGGQR